MFDEYCCRWAVPVESSWISCTLRRSVIIVWIVLLRMFVLMFIGVAISAVSKLLSINLSVDYCWSGAIYNVVPIAPKLSIYLRISASFFDFTPLFRSSDV